MSIGDGDIEVTMIKSKEGLLFVANQMELTPSLLFIIRHKLAARKQHLDCFSKQQMYSRLSDAHFIYMPLLSECFGLFWLTIRKMMANTQLIVIQGRSTMVLSISSCTQFLTLQVAVTLTLTVALMAEIGAVLRGVILQL